jgi:hypothetical protein
LFSVINSSDVSSGFINSNLLDAFNTDDDKPSLQSFDVFCDSDNIIEQEGSVFSLEDMSQGNLILVSGNPSRLFPYLIILEEGIKKKF